MLVGMIGNESRTAYMRAYLEKKGMEVVAIRNGNLEEIGSCGSLVFPYPGADPGGAHSRLRSGNDAPADLEPLSQGLRHVRRQISGGMAAVCRKVWDTAG